MASISNCVSPLSWGLLALATFCAFLFILRPTFSELAGLLAIQLATFLVSKFVEKRIFIKLFPGTELYFSGVDGREFQKFSLSQKTNLIESFFVFPKRRAVFCFVLGLIQIIPSTLIVVFLWNHELSNLMQGLLCAGIGLVGASFFAGVVFIESHIYLSDSISNLHEKFILLDVFNNINVTYSKKEYLLQELLSFVFFVGFVLILQGLVVVSQLSISPASQAVYLFSIGMFGLILFIRLWFLNRVYMIGGLEKIVEQMELVDYYHSKETLALHSTPILAKFDNALNTLILRLKKSEQELSSMIFSEADKSRYRALGEMSAMIAHDLSGPLHVAQYCATQVQEKPELIIQDKRYLNQLVANIERAVELTTSLRAKVRNSPENPAVAGIRDAYQHVLRLLETQYYEAGYKKIQFVFDESLDQLSLAIQRIDLIHILDNLCRNSIENLLKNNVPDPKLEMLLENDSDGNATILMRDNGTGLSEEQFERLTTFRFAQKFGIQPQQGLGLRLTRRLVELDHGDLSLRVSGVSTGTTFCLKLPISQKHA